MTTDCEKLTEFLDEIEAVCRKHNISISHEDGHGAFMFVPFDDFHIKWLRVGYWDEPEGGTR